MQFIGQLFSVNSQAAEDIVISQQVIWDLFWEPSSIYVTQVVGSVPISAIKLLHDHENLPHGTTVALPISQQYDT